MKWIGVCVALPHRFSCRPFWQANFYINLASQILIAAIFALSLNLLVGFGGMTSLGHASYLGVAAYISALLTSRYGLGHGTGAIVSVAGTTANGSLLRRHRASCDRPGLSHDTLALSQVLWGLAYRMSNVTNGDNGIAGLTRPCRLAFRSTARHRFTGSRWWWRRLAFLMMRLLCRRRSDRH